MNVEKKPYVILGGGVSGLAAAWKLAEAEIPVIVLEKNAVVGGMAGTFSYKGYLLDYGPHKIYSQLPIFEEVKQFLSSDLLSVPKTSKIRLRGKYLPYPFGMASLLFTLGPVAALSSAMSYGSTTFLNFFRTCKDTSYEDYIVNRFGQATYGLVFGPYAQKAWGDPKKLDKSLAQTRVVIPSIRELVSRMIFGDQGKKELSASTFYYPAQGAVQMAQKMVAAIEKHNGKIICNATPFRFEAKENRVDALIYKDQHGKEHTLSVAGVISTIPMRNMLQLFSSVPESVTISTKKLRFRKLILLYIEAKASRLIAENWIFFPETKYIFNRLSEQKGFSERMIPADKTVLCVEMTFDPEDPRASFTDQQLYDLVLPQLEECGVLQSSQTISFFTKHLIDGYPVYHIDYKQDLENFFGFVEQFNNVFSIGRQGMFNYVGTIDCIDMGTTTAAFILSKKSKDLWKQERQKFENYVTID